MPTHDKTVQSYNNHADKYNEHIIKPDDAVYHHYYEKPAIRAELPEMEGLSVISIGCGTGVDTHYLKENDADRVVGVDISAGMIDVAKNTYNDIEFYVMDMEQLNFEDKTFDLAYSSLAMHYVSDWKTALSEAQRVLRPGSTYVFSCHHPIDDGVEWFNEENKRGNRLGKTVFKKTGERIIHGDYLSADYHGVRPIDGMLGDMEIRIYQRPISRMVEEIIKSGFRIEKLVEPQPLEAMQEVDPDYEQLKKIPTFMIWVLRRE